ncbi:hypothetical protein KP509_02G003700 [Ceratopteris richardii]|uniref:RING-type domain-containing protein n=1 Tax=Ceratopteris richardii TaxID=49495 RepID=A0A8T2V303_CERRI|nr:hypothetical protein KP509_02G003700 [Ceratopteris richardii]
MIFFVNTHATISTIQEPGAPAYSAIPSKLMEEFSFGPSANQVHYFPKLNISKSMQSMGSSPGSEMDDDANEVTATRFHSYQQMLRNTVDTPFKFSRQKAESQRTSSSSDFLDHLDPRSWRWSGRGFPSMITVGEQEDLNELYIANTVPVCNHNPSTQFESPTCGLCSKAVSQKSLWSFPRALTNKDLPVVGILECGHVYHAECLERATPDALSHDPPCPKCGVKGTKPKMQQGNLTKSEARDPPIIKGQLFHAGVSSYESNDDAELNKSSEMGGHQSCLSEESRKGLLHLTVHTSDKPSVTRSLLRKQFPFRAKVSREAMTSSFGSIRPGYAARVSPENNSRDDDFVMGKKAY